MQTALVVSLRTNSVSPRDSAHDVGKVWSFVGCTSLKFVCALAAHGHCESNKDIASLLAFPSQTEFQKNWAYDAKDIILKSVQKAAVCLLLPSYSKLGLNSLTATNKTESSNYFKSVFVQHADKAKTWMELQTPMKQLQ